MKKPFAPFRNSVSVRLSLLFFCLSLLLNLFFWLCNKRWHISAGEFGAYFLTPFIGSILIFILSKIMVSNRIKKLSKTIEKAEQSSFLTRVTSSGFDEIAKLAEHMNRLLSLFSDLQVQKIEHDHGLKEAQAQTNMRLELEEAVEKLKRSHEHLKRKVKAQELLMEAAHRLGGTLKRESVVDHLVSLIRNKLEYPEFAIFLVEQKKDDKPFLRLAESFGIFPTGQDKHLEIAFGEGITGMVAQTGAPIVVGNLEQEKRVKLWEYQKRSLGPTPELIKTGSLMAVPMLYKGRVVGVMDFFHPRVYVFDEEDVALIHALGAQASLAIVNAELYEATLELATSDPLTGVLNRRAMVRQLENELARAQRFSSPLALLLVDVDYFKSYNDRMGHVLGDLALKSVAQCLQRNLRKVDILARFGGEEFCIILPQTDTDAAKEVAQKLCEAIRTVRIRGVEKQEFGYLSVSIGITLFPDDFPEASDENLVTEMIARADQALYEAKHLGRDRFVYLERQNKNKD